MTRKILAVLLIAWLTVSEGEGRHAPHKAKKHRINHHIRSKLTNAVSTTLTVAPLVATAFHGQSNGKQRKLQPDD